MSFIGESSFTLPVCTKEELLYERSQRQQWWLDDLPWRLGISLKASQRKSGARVLSQVLYGEQASLRLIEQLITLVPDLPARRFLVSQAQEETRHIAVFSRYLELLDEVQPVNEAFTEMVEGMLALPSVEEKLVGMSLLIEGMALELFHSMAVSIQDPLLQAILRRVFVDESRHVAFGIDYSRRVLSHLDETGREKIATGGGRFALLAAEMIREEQAVAAQFGLDLKMVQARTLRVLFRRLKQVGLINSLELF